MTTNSRFCRPVSPTSCGEPGASSPHSNPVRRASSWTSTSWPPRSHNGDFLPLPRGSAVTSTAFEQRIRRTVRRQTPFRQRFDRSLLRLRSGSRRCRIRIREISQGRRRKSELERPRRRGRAGPPAGAEYGVDGVYSLHGDGSLLGALARRTDRMRGGDTDVATTVTPEVFTASMAALGDLLKPVGPIDVDFREAADGTPLIIDVNPRFGGGYPFC